MSTKEEFFSHIEKGYTTKGDFITMGAAMFDGEAVTNAHVKIPLKTLNRHGLIAGATGTGKTKTLQVLAENLSDGYFESRPNGSKLGAWASNQSEIVTSRKALDKQLKETTEKFNGKEITRPPHWGGFLVKPVSIEFWQGRPNRMHDRMRYSLQKDFSWKLERLAP